MNSIVRDSKKTLICVVAHFTQSLTVQTRTPRLFVCARLASEYFFSISYVREDKASYSSTAFIRLTPDATASSFLILNFFFPS